MEGRLNNFQRPKSENSSGRVPDVNTVWLYGDLQPWLIFPGLLLCKHCVNLNSLMQPLVKCLCWKNTLIFFCTLCVLCEPYYIAKTLGATGMQNVLFPVSNSQKRTTAKNIRALASPLELLCDFSWNRPHKRLFQADGAVMPAQFKSCVACCEVMRLTKGSYALGSGKILILDVKHLNTHKKLRQQGRDQHTNRERSDFAH